MTKAELIKMIEHYNDDEELMFVYETRDRDGYPEDSIAKVYKIVTTKAECVRGECGIHRYKEKGN